MNDLIKPPLKVREILPARSDLSALNGIINTLDYVYSTVSNGTLETISISGSLRNTGVSIINSTSGSLTLTLPDGVLYGTQKELSLIPTSGNLVTVQTTNGSFFMNSSLSYRLLIYTQNGWVILSNTNNSFFPTGTQLTTTPLIGTGYIANGSNVLMGASSALSSNGLIYFQGAPGDDLESGSLGAVWVWVYNSVSTTWIQQTKLVGTGFTDYMSSQGFSVACDSSGTWLASGSPTNGLNVGGVWIFQYVDDAWTQRSLLIADDAIGNASQGCSVSLDSGAITCAIGGYSDSSNIGAVWIWSRSGNVWTEQQKITASDHIGQANQGSSVCLSTDGTLLVYGGTGDSSGVGACWIWSLNSGIWTEVTKLVPSSNIGACAFGTSVCLSANGELLFIGAPADNSYIGAVYVYGLVNGTWTELQKIIPSDVLDNSCKFGTSCAVSGDGNTLVIGGPEDGDYTGSTYVFVRESGTTWTQVNKLVATGTSSNSQQGYSVALSNNGSILVTGVPYDGITGGSIIFD